MFDVRGFISYVSAFEPGDFARLPMYRSLTFSDASAFYLLFWVFLPCMFSCLACISRPPRRCPSYRTSCPSRPSFLSCSSCSSLFLRSYFTCPSLENKRQPDKPLSLPRGYYKRLLNIDRSEFHDSLSCRIVRPATPFPSAPEGGRRRSGEPALPPLRPLHPRGAPERGHRTSIATSSRSDADLLAVIIILAVVITLTTTIITGIRISISMSTSDRTPPLCSGLPTSFALRCKSNGKLTSLFIPQGRLQIHIR